MVNHEFPYNIPVEQWALVDPLANILKDCQIRGKIWLYPDDNFVSVEGVRVDLLPQYGLHNHLIRFPYDPNKVDKQLLLKAKATVMYTGMVQESRSTKFNGKMPELRLPMPEGLLAEEQRLKLYGVSMSWLLQRVTLPMTLRVAKDSDQQVLPNMPGAVISRYEFEVRHQLVDYVLWEQRTFLAREPLMPLKLTGESNY